MIDQNFDYSKWEISESELLAYILKNYTKNGFIGKEPAPKYGTILMTFSNENNLKDVSERIKKGLFFDEEKMQQFFETTPEVYHSKIAKGIFWSALLIIEVFVLIKIFNWAAEKLKMREVENAKLQSSRTILV